jgi:hypothetical protein
MVRLFYIALVLLGFTISARWPMKAIAATESPNVIVIFVDDQVSEKHHRQETQD